MEHDDIRHKLSEYLDNTVASDEKISIEEHLATCAECADALRELRKTIEHLHQINEVEPPAWMTQKVMSRVRAEAEKRRSLFRRLFFPLAIKLPLQTVVVLFLAVTAYYIYMNIDPREKYAEPQVEMAAKKEAREVSRAAPERRLAEEAPARRKDVEQAPEYKSLDMKYSYERPAPPEPAAPQAAAPPRSWEAEGPTPAARAERADPAARTPRPALLDKEEKQVAGVPRDETGTSKRASKTSGATAHLTLLAKDVTEAAAAATKAVVDAGGMVVKSDSDANATVITVTIGAAALPELRKTLEKIGTVQDRIPAMAPDQERIVLELSISKALSAAPP